MQRDQYKNILKRDMDALYQSSGAALTANKSRPTWTWRKRGKQWHSKAISSAPPRR